MRARIVLGSLCFVLVSVGLVFSQAAAEGAMVHAGSAAATAKAGSALGNALSRATSNLGGQMQAVTQPKAAPGRIQEIPQAKGQTAQPVSTANSAPGGSLITSIHGAHTNCSAPPAKGTTSEPGSPVARPSSQSMDCTVKPQPSTRPKSVINLTPSR
jgi:hypothetical protein